MNITKDELLKSVHGMDAFELLEIVINKDNDHIRNDVECLDIIRKQDNKLKTGEITI